MSFERARATYASRALSARGGALARRLQKESELLEALVADGPAAESINDTRARLLKGEAPWQQTSAFLVEEETDTPLAMVSACLDGDPRADEQEDATLKRAAGNPYINIVFRDRGQHNRVLLDGETRLGTAVLWAFLELGLRERPGLNGKPRLGYALVATENEPAIGAFESVEFERHAASGGRRCSRAKAEKPGAASGSRPSPTWPWFARLGCLRRRAATSTPTGHCSASSTSSPATRPERPARPSRIPALPFARERRTRPQEPPYLDIWASGRSQPALLATTSHHAWA